MNEADGVLNVCVVLFQPEVIEIDFLFFNRDLSSGSAGMVPIVNYV